MRLIYILQPDIESLDSERSLWGGKILVQDTVIDG